MSAAPTGLEPEGVPTGGDALSGDDLPTANDGTAGADTPGGDAGSADADQVTGTDDDLIDPHEASETGITEEEFGSNPDGLSGDS
jgi:hypothetical protein